MDRTADRDGSCTDVVGTVLSRTADRSLELAQTSFPFFSPSHPPRLNMGQGTVGGREQSLYSLD